MIDESRQDMRWFINRFVNLLLSYNSPAVEPAMILSTLKLLDKTVMVSDSFTFCLAIFLKVSDLYSDCLTKSLWMARHYSSV